MTNRIFILAIVFPLLVLLSEIHPARGAVMEAWVQRYSNVVSNSMDEAFKVAIDQAGDVIVSGYSDDGTSTLDPMLIGLVSGDMLTTKYAGTDGLVIWQKRHRSPTYTVRVFGIAVDSRGNAIVTGSSQYNELVSYAAKYAAGDGTLLWENIAPGESRAVAVDANDNVVIAGSSLIGPGYIAKYDGADGRALWMTTVDIRVGWTAIALDGGGNVVALGVSQNGTSLDFYTGKFAAADGALLWERSYDSPANTADEPSALAVDSSGNVVVTGSSWTGRGHSADYYTAKYAAANGALLWERRYNGPPDLEDMAFGVALDGTDNVVVTGQSFVSEGNRDYYTVKYAAADGAVMWDRRYDAEGNVDGRSAVAVTADGDVLLAGQSWNGVNFPKYYIAKYAGADGSLLWEKTGVEGVPAAIALGDGSIVVAGSSAKNGSHFDAYTVKYSTLDGALVWEQGYNALANSVDVATAVALDAGGNVAVAGQSVGNEGNPDYYTAKYAGTTGALLWEKRYNGPGNGTDRPQGIAVDQSGNVVVTGYAWNGTNWDYYTAKYAAADGALLWDRRHDGPGNGDDTAYAVAVDSSGNVVVTGDSSGTASGGDYYTAKYAAADGALLWERRYNGLASGYDSARAVAVDRNDNVIVTGYTSVADYHDYYTAKYAGTNGALLWENRAGTDRYDNAFAVAVDRNNNVVVTGGSNDDYYTIKLGAADGRLLWERRYNGFGNWDSARAVVVDANDNVVVTGYSWNALSNADYYTAKYAATDGALLWEKRYDGPASGSDSANALAVDRDGNVVVTGRSSDDYYTAKYAADDGALLWEKRYNGPANQYDFASGVAVGPNGMVVVTGTTDSFGYAVPRSDCTTIAYRDNLPSVSIESVPAGLRVRLNGVPGRSYELQRAAAVSGPWSTITTLTASSDGRIEYVETTRPAGSVFYRARTQ